MGSAVIWLVTILNLIYATAAFGDNLNSFQIKIKPKKEIYKDSPLRITVDFINQSSQDLKFFIFEENCVLYFYLQLKLYAVNDGKISEIPLSSPTCSVRSWPGTSATLAPKAQHRFAIDLNQHIDVFRYWPDFGKGYKSLAISKGSLKLRKGQYRLYVVLDSSKLAPFWNDHIISKEQLKSNEIKFEVR